MSTILKQESGHGPIEQYSGGYRIISTEHAKIHDGNGYSHASLHLALANSGTFYHYIDVPAGVYPHLRDIALRCEGAPFLVELYESGTVSANGTTAVIRNNSRNSTKMSTVLMYHAPTVLTDGDLIDVNLVPGTGAAGGSGDSGTIEWILKPSTKYFVKITNQSGAARDFTLGVYWYE